MRALSLLLIMTGAGPTVCGAAGGPVQVNWTEFGNRVVGRRIAFQLPQGCDVEAKVVAVRPQSASITIRNGPDSVRCPKGPRDIPREAFTSVRVMGGGSAIRTGLAILGGIGGYALSVLATFAVKGDEWGVSGGHVVLWTTSAAAGAVGGYYLGKRLTRGNQS
ncbi:MAG: hypothetical protein ACRD7E_10770 [Bryobacteraceae bacterium]